MNSFPLKIVTPDGLQFEGQAEQLTVRTTSGDIGILAGHTNCVAPLGMGRATVVTEEGRRYAACIGGMVSVVNGAVTLVATTFEWADEIDLQRAEKAQQIAEENIELWCNRRIVDAKSKDGKILTITLEDSKSPGLP